MTETRFTVREAKAEDVHAMLGLWAATPGIGLGVGDDEEDLKRFIARNPRTCLVAWKGGILAGAVVGGFDGRRGYLYHLAVRKDYQSQGIGKALVAEVLDRFREIGARRVHLLVFTTNQQAVAFYTRLGWRLRQDVLVASWDCEPGKDCGC